MRLSFSMECVLALAVGLFLVREDLAPDLLVNWRGHGLERLGYFVWLFGKLSAGAGVVFGLGTWLERARRRGPEPWGLGRWTWSVEALSFILFTLEYISSTMATALCLGGRHFPPKWSILFMPNNEAIYWRCLPPVVISYLIARPSGAVPADAREWAGRIYAVLIITSYVTSRALIWMEFNGILGLK